VVTAVGLSDERALGSLRLSLGVTTTADDVDLALAAIPPAVARLRQR
jgi:cysteine desulfurase